MNSPHTPQVAAIDLNRHLPKPKASKDPWRFGEPPLPFQWRRLQKVALFLLCVGCASSVVSLSLGKESSASKPAADTKWKKYENGRFGFVLTYPASLIASREAENGGGREFHSPDKEFSVSAFAHFFVPETDDSFEARWKEELETSDVTITYKKKADSWYVVSGTTKDGTEYYHKLLTKGKNWAAFHITYPHAKRDKYDPWVERIAKEFVAFREGDYDRLD